RIDAELDVGTGLQSRDRQRDAAVLVDEVLHADAVGLDRQRRCVLLVVAVVGRIVTRILGRVVGRVLSGIFRGVVGRVLGGILRRIRLHLGDADVVAGGADADLEDVFVVGGAGVDVVEEVGGQGDLEFAVGVGDGGGGFVGAFAVCLGVAVDDDADFVAGGGAGVGDGGGEVVADGAFGCVVGVVGEVDRRLGRLFGLAFHLRGEGGVLAVAVDLDDDSVAVAQLADGGVAVGVE